MSYFINPIGLVESNRDSKQDDFWGAQQSRIVIAPEFCSAALAGLDAFSHVEVLFLFHQVAESNIVTGARHPRNNPAWPQVGIFAQRAKNRPNRIGSTICRLVKVEDRCLTVVELDAIAGTPVIDIKPVMREFLPREQVCQPNWAGELMRDYWRHAKADSGQTSPCTQMEPDPQEDN
ncbi:SAM-dependent methyltransferase [Methylomonas koyamae]|uniref:SAM-dependent methyltransferase n=1 Tax=Methylomonas koyamae TaxID=702114 RepID=UPI0009EBC6E5|nr:SAM-dependent methyltransferase [Methylomonas koyamae]BBL59839.1 tRNA (N6-threonylcarbamoyladenosine(37)-N6)-methyltransferase TrmO [Methylomonas koyamae]